MKRYDKSILESVSIEHIIMEIYKKTMQTRLDHYIKFLKSLE